MGNQAQYNKRYYEKNKHKWKEYAKKYRTERDNQLKAIFYSARSRSKIRGLEWNLEIEDVLNCPDVCPVLGIEIKFQEGPGSHHSPSIDRFDNTKGYTKDNIRMISLRANTLKSDGTLKEFEHLIKYLSNNS